MTKITIEPYGQEHAVLVGGKLTLMLSDDQLIELTRRAGIELQQMRNRRAAESARTAANDRTAHARASDFTELDLELS